MLLDTLDLDNDYLSMAKKKRRSMFLFFIIGGMGFLVAGVVAFFLAEASLKWPEATGQVVSTNIAARSGSDDEPGGLHEPIVSYIYTVDGQSHRNSRIKVVTSLYKSESRAREVLARYRVGSSVPVYYNPDMPSYSVLERGGDLKFPIAGLIGGFVLLMFAVFERRARKKEEDYAHAFSKDSDEPEESSDELEESSDESEEASDESDDRVRDPVRAEEIARNMLRDKMEIIEANPMSGEVVRAGFRAEVVPELYGVYDRVFAELSGASSEGSEGTGAAETGQPAAGRAGPADEDEAIALIDEYISTNRRADAEQLIEEAIAAQGSQKSPRLANLQHRKARLAALAGDKQAELQWLESAFESDRGNGHVVAELAVLAIELGELDLALRALRAVTVSKIESPLSVARGFLMQAQIAHQRGDDRRAAMLARKAHEEDPDLVAAAELIKRLG